MKKLAVIVACLITSCLFAQSKFQLAPPILIYKSAFIKGAAEVSILFNQPGATVHYTLDGTIPTTASEEYTQPLKINGVRQTLKAKAFGPGYEPSETSSAEFIGGGKEIRDITFTPPHESYGKAPANILHDNIGGLPQYGSGSWLGYNVDTVEINIALNKQETISAILLDQLQDENSWIFLPEKIELYYLDGAKKYVLISSILNASLKQGDKHCVVEEIKLQRAIMTDKLKLVIKPVQSIPDWHAGKGQHGWFFIDEIKVY